jgi:hypothetical protein
MIPARPRSRGPQRRDRQTAMRVNALGSPIRSFASHVVPTMGLDPVAIKLRGASKGGAVEPLVLPTP